MPSFSRFWPDVQYFLSKVQIARADSLEIKEQILHMSPEQRKILGINKSTLWYQKRNLTEGKARVYGKVLGRFDS